MDDTQNREQGILADVSNALVRLHKEQFGRGPTRARSAFAGPDMLLCMFQDALLPAERKLVAMGDHNRVRDSRTAFQAATASEFIDAIEAIVGRKVEAFASAVDPGTNTVFENFFFAPRPPDGDGAPASDA